MDEKQQKNVGYFNQEGLHVNLNPGLIWQKYIQQEDPFHRQIECKLKKETSVILYLEHGYVLSWVLDIRERDAKYLESFEMWCWRRME